MIQQVRSFNRLVTERVGALTDDFLGRNRPLGQSRVLWEIGPAGTAVSTLRARLGLDSGYLSRLLRSLEADGLVDTGSGVGDGRGRVASLTPAGVTEWKLLDQESDAFAAQLLAPLNDQQQERLVGAMAEVERLLTASIVEIAEIADSSAEADWCVDRYFAVLADRFETTFDPGETRPHDGGHFLVARLRGEPVGCVTVKIHSDQGVGEIKRMWVADSTRGLGLGRRLLTEAEGIASNADMEKVQLDTNRTLTEAIAMYRSSDYLEVDAFNDEPYAHHWFEKPLSR